MCESACLRILDHEPSNCGALCTLAQCLSKVICAPRLPQTSNSLSIGLTQTVQLRRPDEALSRAYQAVQVG